MTESNVLEGTVGAMTGSATLEIGSPALRLRPLNLGDIAEAEKTVGMAWSKMYEEGLAITTLMEIMAISARAFEPDITAKEVGERVPYGDFMDRMVEVVRFLGFRQPADEE